MIKDTDKGWEKLKRELGRVNNTSVSVGLVSGKSAEINILKGIINEYGSPKKKIPSRPFMRYTFTKYTNEVVAFHSKLYGNILDGKETAYAALRKIGLFYKGLLQLSIRTGPWVKNAPATIRRKKSTKPLIDSGEMLRDLNYRIDK